MKQQLWILNSSLLAILLLSIFAGMFLQQPAPKFKARRHVVEEQKAAKLLSKEEAKTIYQYDLFGTFVKPTFAPSQQQLVTSMPQPKSVPTPTPPAEPKVEFMPPLTLSLKGIAFSADEKKSVSIIEDEAKKENVYHVGDSIKDAQLIKIGQNRISLLRTNGQHETFFLRKEEREPTPAAEQTWDNMVKKIDSSTFQIDSKQFTQEIPTLGLLSEKLSLVTAYDKGEPIGLKIVDLEPNSIGSSIGLAKNDIITQINNITTADKKERMKIYDAITQLKEGDSITVSLTRSGQTKILNYKLGKIEHARKRIFEPGPADEKTPAASAELQTKLSKMQENEKKRRDFAKKHQADQQNVISEIRKRLLEGIQARMHNARIR